MGVMDGALYPIPASALNNQSANQGFGRLGFLPITPTLLFAQTRPRGAFSPRAQRDPNRALTAISTSAFAGPGHPGGNHPGGHPGHPWRPSPPARQVHYRYGATPVAYAVTRQAVAGPCTCLSKQYTPEGAVLFKDIRAEKVSSRNLLQA